MKKFEYKYLNLRDEGFWSTKFDWEKLTTQLNLLGAEGWEVVSAIDTNISHGASKEVVILLKREKP